MALECFSFLVDTLFHFSFGKKAQKESSYMALHINFQFSQLLTIRPLTKKKKKKKNPSEYLIRFQPGQTVNMPGSTDQPSR